MKVFIAHSSPLYDNMFIERGWEIVDTLEEASLVLFTGGSDVTPSYYGHGKHSSTLCSPERDKKEALLYNQAKALGKPMVGICRGGQFLHVMNGGVLWQDVDGHSTVRGHYARNSSDGRIVLVTSTHHQMMFPNEGEMILEGFQTGNTYKDMELYSKTLRVKKKGREAEAIWHKDTASLCFQPHPEMVGADSECQVLFFEYLSKYFGFETNY